MSQKHPEAQLVLMGKKKGMTQRFDDKGNVEACTVIEVLPNIVTQVKTTESDGYEAIQLSADPIVVKQEYTLKARLSKPLIGHFQKVKVRPARHLFEARLEKADKYQVGQELTVEAFKGIKYLDATAVSKGKGYQGVMKRHNFAGGPAAHGSGFHRHAGSTGMRSTPGRCLPGGKKAGHMGAERVTVQNLELLEICPEDNVIILKGAVPGPVGGAVKIFPARKLVHAS